MPEPLDVAIIALFVVGVIYCALLSSLLARSARPMPPRLSARSARGRRA